MRALPHLEDEFHAQFRIRMSIRAFQIFTKAIVAELISFLTIRECIAIFNYFLEVWDPKSKILAARTLTIEAVPS